MGIQFLFCSLFAKKCENNSIGSISLVTVEFWIWTWVDIKEMLQLVQKQRANYISSGRRQQPLAYFSWMFWIEGPTLSAVHDRGSWLFPSLLQPQTQFGIQEQITQTCPPALTHCGAGPDWGFSIPGRHVSASPAGDVDAAQHTRDLLPRACFFGDDFLP